MADSRVGVAASRALLRALPSATHFTVEQVATSMESVIQRVVAKEGPALVVRGHDHWERLPMSTRRANNRNMARNRAMSAVMQAVCARYRVVYVERPPVSVEELRTMLGTARFHNSAEGERISGEVDGRAMVGVWKAGTVPPRAGGLADVRGMHG